MLISTQWSDTVLKLVAIMINELRAVACRTSSYMCCSLPVLPYHHNNRGSYLPQAHLCSTGDVKAMSRLGVWHLGHTPGKLLQPPAASSGRSPERQRGHMQSTGTHVQISTALVYHAVRAAVTVGAAMPHTCASHLYLTPCLTHKQQTVTNKVSRPPIRLALHQC